MLFPEPKKPTYSLEEFARWRNHPADDFLCLAEEGLLQICKLLTAQSLFLNKGKDELLNEPIPINHHEARELVKKYGTAIYSPSCYISLVITLEEKTRFDIQYPISEGGTETIVPSKAPATRHGVQNRMTYAIHNAIVRLKKLNGKFPSADEVFTLLKSDDITGAVVDYGYIKGTDKRWLVWEDNDGNNHDIQYKTVANKISLIRSNNNNLQ